jgi:hypothetical protein
MRPREMAWTQLVEERRTIEEILGSRFDSLGEATLAQECLRVAVREAHYWAARAVDRSLRGKLRQS